MNIIARPVATGCRGTGAPPFLLKGGCNDEFAPPPMSHMKEIASLNLLKSSYQSSVWV